MPTSRRPGFTLLEIAFVLAIIGLLATLAVPGYRHLMLRARAAEARSMLEGIADAQLRYFRDHGAFLACAPTPAGEPPRGTRARFDTAAAGWSDLGFRADGPVRYRYEVVLAGGGFQAIARGDLDGDGRASTFTLDGATLALAIEDELE